MRRPYEINRKYRTAQAKYFEQEVRTRCAKCPGNCIYNQAVYFNDARAEVQLCTFGQKPGERLDTTKLVVCNKVAQAVACPTYAGRYGSREDVAAALSEELKDPETRRKRFPDIEALRWVLEKDLHAYRELPPNWWTRSLFHVIVFLEWVIKRFNKSPFQLGAPGNVDPGAGSDGDRKD